MPVTAKITRKGQVTIPKEMRDVLQSDVVEFEKIGNDKIIIKPVKSVAGSLKKYSKKYVPLKEVRDKVWEDVVRDRVGKAN